jgi:phenylacetate-coenzyme A ligase PaaK-like adenylate-forming protein
MAMGIVWGRKLDPRNIERLVGDALATLREFGEPGADARILTDGPMTDPEERAHIATTNVRRTAGRLAKQSSFYTKRFAAAGVDPRKLEVGHLDQVPVTVKADLTQHANEFLCQESQRYLATRTTGTTGKPTEVWLSRYEMSLWPAMGALAAVVRDDLRPDDVMQVNVSSRATAAVSLDVAVCRLIGTGCRIIGLVPPDESLDALTEGVTLLSTCASYLGQLVVAARRRGLGPSDFTLRRIDVGGEVLSPTLADAARMTFGAETINDLFGMTEILPVTGRHCSQDHLHHDITMGLCEYVDLDTGLTAEPGALASVVVTPFFPYRECMPVFRYDTRDVVRPLDNKTLSCEISGLPATSKILGKADQLIRLGPNDIVSPRELVEAIDALPTEPWPARFRATVDSGRITLTLPASAVGDLGEAASEQHFADRGLDVRVAVVDDEQASRLRPLRCDLRETTFAARPALIGV